MDAIVRFEGMYGEDRWPCQSSVHTHTYTRTHMHTHTRTHTHTHTRTHTPSRLLYGRLKRPSLTALSRSVLKEKKESEFRMGRGSAFQRSMEDRRKALE